jgi:hypothetical protein
MSPEKPAPCHSADIRISSRIIKPSLKIKEITEVKAFQSTIQSHIGFDAQLLTNLIGESHVDIIHPIAFSASSDHEIIYLVKAMKKKKPDANQQFKQAMKEEIKAYEESGH